MSKNQKRKAMRDAKKYEELRDLYTHNPVRFRDRWAQMVVSMLGEMRFHWSGQRHLDEGYGDGYGVDENKLRQWTSDVVTRAIDCLGNIDSGALKEHGRETVKLIEAEGSRIVAFALEPRFLKLAKKYEKRL